LLKLEKKEKAKKAKVWGVWPKESEKKRRRG